MEVSGILDIVRAFFDAMRKLLEAFGILEPKEEPTGTADA